MPPAELFESHEPNIFANGLEGDLGDAIVEGFAGRLRLIAAPELTGYLNRIGERITAHVPGRLPYRYYLMDMPSVQAVSLPGGRVYVSRKLVAFAKSEDELAGAIAHEIGHAASHQGAIYMTKALRVVLGVHELKDRQDVFDRYFAFLENYARHPEKLAALSHPGDKDQFAADRIGLFAAAAAGYDPEALVRLFDRMAGTKMETGNFISDLFNYTRPEITASAGAVKGSATGACILSRGGHGTQGECRGVHSLASRCRGLHC